MKRKNKRLLLITSPFALAGLMLISIYLMQVPPPAEIIKQSRVVISQAEKKGAKSYAPRELAKAQEYREQLIEELKNQNNKPVYRRQFKRVEELAGLSIAKAKKAMSEAEKNREQMEQHLDEKMKIASGKLHEFENKFYHLPLPDKIRQNYIQSKLLYNEGESALKRNDNLASFKKIEAALENITKANTNAYRFITGYFNLLPSWQKWVRETIQWSADSNDYAIVVDKLAFTCTLYKSGRMYKVFDIEMGPNWIGDKIQKGDRATPEGKYHITKKLENSQTIYYKALLINYPNEEDRKRFSLNKKNGILPARAQIGSLIEIHGEGGKGIHWTDGCVALVNKDMGILYQYVRVGTPVTIVGSTKPFSQIFE